MTVTVGKDPMTGEDDSGEPDDQRPPPELRMVPFARRPGDAALSPGEKELLYQWLESCSEGDEREALLRIIRLFG